MSCNSPLFFLCHYSLRDQTKAHSGVFDNKVKQHFRPEVGILNHEAGILGVSVHADTAISHKAVTSLPGHCTQLLKWDICVQHSLCDL